MISSEPKILEQAGIPLTIQTLETTAEYILLRIRSDEKIPLGHGDVQVLAASREWFTLSDLQGTKLTEIQTSSLGDGPFAGIIDVAFPADPGLDLESQLILESEKVRIAFKL